MIKEARSGHGFDRIIGRRQDLEALETRLRRGDRLVTIFGPPGMGKTCLAWHLFRKLESTDREVHFCDLTQTNCVHEALVEIARVLGLQQLGAGSESTAGDHDAFQPPDAIGTALVARGDILLFLDNLEQLTPEIGRILSRWLELAPGARFVVTSRIALRTRAEHLFEVEALRLPEEEDWTSDAMSLFFERAQEAEPAFRATPDNAKTVATIVRHLQGIPLALELAASQMARVGPAELLAQLKQDCLNLTTPFIDAEPRHRSLHRAITSSWNRLPPSDQVLLSQLAIFRGPFSERAATALTEDPQTSEALQRLRESSLLRVHRGTDGDGTRRWEMFVAIRDFVRAAGSAPPSKTIQERYSHYWLACGERWVAANETDKGRESRRLLATHLRDFEAAHQFFSSEDSGAVERKRMALVIFESVRQWMPVVALKPLSDALATNAQDDGWELDARLHIAIGAVQRDLANYESAMDAFDRARGLVRSDTAIEAELDFEEGVMCFAQGRTQTARCQLERAARTSERCNEQHLCARARIYLGRVLAEALLDTNAFDQDTQAIAMLQDGDSWALSVAEMFWNAHRLLFDRPFDIDELTRNAEYLRASGDHSNEAVALTGCGLANQEAGRLSEARRAYESALWVARRVGVRQVEGFAHLRIAMCLHEEWELNEARSHYSVAIRRFEVIRDTRHLVLAHTGFAALLSAQNETALAETHLANARQYLDEQEPTGFESLLPLVHALHGFHESSNAVEGAEESLASAVDAVQEEIVGLESTESTNERRSARVLANTSPEVRWLIRIARSALRTQSVAEFWRDGSGFRLGSDDAVVVPKGPVLRRVLALLVEQRTKAAGTPIPVESVLKQCWPGQRMQADAGQKRVQESIRRLRRLGLEPMIRTDDEGYALDPSVPVSVVAPPSAKRTASG